MITVKTSVTAGMSLLRPNRQVKMKETLAGIFWIMGKLMSRFVLVKSC
jgi:hypothetical protein